MTERISSDIYRALKGIFCVYKPPNISTGQLIHSLKTIVSNVVHQLQAKFALITVDHQWIRWKVCLWLLLELCKLPINESQAKVMQENKLMKRHTTQYIPPTSQLTSLQEGQKSTTNNLTQLDRSSNIYSNNVTRISRLSQEDSPLNMDADDVQLHPLVLGDLWRPQDMKITPIDILSPMASGVLPFSFGRKAAKTLRSIKLGNPVKVYRATVRLGVATDNFQPDGRVLERASFKHVTQPTVDRVLAGIQATFQQQQFFLSEVDIQSQEAYEIASKGLLRPKYNSSGEQAVVYSIKPVEFSPPDLVVEMHCVNENGLFLTKLIHDLGVDLRCGAVCTKLRRLRYGHFDVSHALAHGQWTCDNIMENIELCRSVEATSLLDRANQLLELSQNKRGVISGSSID